MIPLRNKSLSGLFLPVLRIIVRDGLTQDGKSWSSVERHWKFSFKLVGKKKLEKLEAISCYNNSLILQYHPKEILTPDFLQQ